MQFKSIGELIKAFKTFDGAKVTSLLKNSGSLESAAKMLDLANVKTDKFMLLKDAFKDAKDDAINAALGISKVGDASTESTSKVKSLGSAIVGAFKTHPFLIAGTAIATIGTIAYTVYKNIKQGYIEAATEATSVWNESKKSLEDYASKYQELKSQLESGNLSEAETISIKQQILDIQNQIVSAYGESAAGIDLINGKLDTQLAKIQSISREESKRNINENLNSYKDAEYEMTKSRTYSLGLIDGTEASDEINKIVESFKDKGIYSNSNGLVTEIKFTGDATQASEVINEFESQIRDLQKEFGEDNSLINSVLDWSSDALKDNKENVLDVYQNNYKSYLEQQLYSDGYGQYLVDYAKSIDEYNTALLSGDTSKIQESKQAFDEANEAKNEFLSGDGKEKFGFLFDEIIQSLDLSTIKLIDFKEAMTEASDGNQFKDSEKSLQKFAKQLQKLSLNKVDIEDAFFTDGFQKGEIAARRLGEVWGITTDSSKEDVMSFIDVLVELGLITDSVTGATNELASAIDEVKNRESLYNQIDNNINSNKRFDAITAADETRNAGDDYVSADKYLDEAKEMYDKGLIGTDDFKSRAAYFSPTGSDDPANFIENYRKASRYLTEDATGVQAFLKDLAKKTNEAGEAMASYNKETGKWTYSIDDIEKAAQKMGIGTEFMLDMFGRLEDYGFSNNFASSVEEASDKIIKKATELAKAKATLAEMETTGQYTTIDENGNEVKTVANQTAITAQREEIALLENDLLELQNLKTQLAAKDAQDYAEQIQIAKETYNSLAEERKRILEENTYGEDTKTVAALMEAEMKQIAQDNQLTIDAELNLVNPDEIQNEVKDLTIPTSVQLIVDEESDIERLGGYLSKLSDTYSPKIIVDIENEEQIDQVASQLASIPINTDANLTFNVQNQEEADSLSSKIENLKNESGATFTYSVNVVGDTQSVNDVSTDKESVIDVITKGTENVKKLNDEIAKVEDKTSNIFAITTGYQNVVNLVNKVKELPLKKTSIIEVKEITSKESKASGTLISPSRASGTAYNVLNYRPAYANGKVSLSKDETALINELGILNAAILNIYRKSI